MARPQRFRLICTPEHATRRLDHVLADWLPTVLGQPVSRAKVRKLIVAGAVYLNGRRTRIASKELIPRAVVEVYVDRAKLEADSTSGDRVWNLTPAAIIFEDAHLIVVNKPPGLPTQPTLDEARNNLFADVKRFLRERDGGDPYVGLHHRLDRDTSGVILFTKTTAANPGVARLFAEHRAQKTYQAIAEIAEAGARPPENWEVKNYLAKARGTGKQSRMESVRAGGDFAHTDFRVLERLGRFLRVEACPRTGRMHQIRVHLSELGLPIVGDSTYGGTTKVSPRLMLHAAALEFEHPITGSPLHLKCELPEDFEKCLTQLRI